MDNNKREFSGYCVGCNLVFEIEERDVFNETAAFCPECISRTEINTNTVKQLASAHPAANVYQQRRGSILADKA